MTIGTTGTTTHSCVGAIAPATPPVGGVPTAPASPPVPAPFVGPGAMNESNSHEVRDPALARSWLDRIARDVLLQFPTLGDAIAVGYRPTRSGGGVLHYTLAGYTSIDPTNPDGGVSDFRRPFSLMVDNGRIVGVMLRAPGAPVDFGAGTWHAHEAAGDPAPLMHVWFDRPLDQAFGGHVPGFMPNEPMPVPRPTPPPAPAPAPKPTPVPDPQPMPVPRPMPTPTPMPPPSTDPRQIPAPPPPSTPPHWLLGGCAPGGC